MVDFNNEGTVAIPAVDVMRILILQHREYFIDAIEAYMQELGKNVNVETNVIRARIISLYLSVNKLLKRKLDKKLYDEVSYKKSSYKYEDILEAFIIIDDLLDDIGLTKIDNKISLGGNIRERNKAQGWK